jgi:autotransporter passenger strand-loop-strand repeat protein
VLALFGSTTAVISGFAPGDQIILDYVTFSSGATVSLTSGHMLKVVEGGSTYALQLDPAQTFSGTFHVGPGGFGANTTIELATTITSVTSGQTVSRAVVGNANVQDVLSGGIAVSITVSSGGEQDVQSGGTANATTLVGGVQVVYGIASTTSVTSYGLVDDFGSVLGAVVSYGYLEINAGGTASTTMVGSAGDLEVNAGGTASNTVVFGFESVSGVAISTTLSGGVEEVLSGGTANITVLSSGAQLYVYGGVASNTSVGSGSLDYVSSSGTASGMTVLSGGSAVVESGASAYSATVSGGHLEVAGTLSGLTDLGGTIQVDSTGLVSGATMSGGRDVPHRIGYRHDPERRLYDLLRRR